jgi:hypothetical protein
MTIKTVKYENLRSFVLKNRTSLLNVSINTHGMRKRTMNTQYYISFRQKFSTVFTLTEF